jgi:hypothetical protein
MPDRGPDRDRSRPQAGAPSDELVLAAIERAALHRARDTPDVPIWAILDHLAIRRRSDRDRSLRRQLERLIATGALEHVRRRSVSRWALSSAGLRRLQTSRLAGHSLQLPESPQHLAWRRARTDAACEIERFRQILSNSLRETARLIEREPPAHSDAWFELGERLRHDARRLGSASHCLFEWAEPHDGCADVDERREPSDHGLDEAECARRRARRAGRRSVHLWEEALC